MFEFITIVAAILVAQVVTAVISVWLVGNRGFMKWFYKKIVKISIDAAENAEKMVEELGKEE